MIKRFIILTFCFLLMFPFAVNADAIWDDPVITITTQPEARTIATQGSITGSLSVAASVTEDAILSYQWYSNTSNSNSGGIAIGGETSSSFAIPASLTGGTYYCFCEVMATYWAPSVLSSVRSNTATVTIIGVTVSPNEITIAVGETQTLVATVTSENATATNIDVIWSSSSSNIADVNQSGVVRGISAGTATITATGIDGNKAACLVTVTQPSGNSGSCSAGFGFLALAIMGVAPFVLKKNNKRNNLM